MLPVVAIVGRPNVGKSTLFNALTRTRDALVADQPGVTRDRQYGISRVGDSPCVLVDTGGLVAQAKGVEYLTARQVHQAIDESHLVLFIVSARDGLTASDEEIAAKLRQHDRKVLLVANKTDGVDIDTALTDFASLGMDDASPVASAHRRGLEDLMDRVSDILPVPELDVAEDTDEDRLRLAIIGRPNVGKSTLVNRLLGEERVMAMDMPGTTRDTISAFMERDGRRYELIDTAGIRRRSRVSDVIEKFSVIKALQAIQRAHDGCRRRLYRSGCHLAGAYSGTWPRPGHCNQQVGWPGKGPPRAGTQEPRSQVPVRTLGQADPPFGLTWLGYCRVTQSRHRVLAQRHPGDVYF
jgi:GTP-binding protein